MRIDRLLVCEGKRGKICRFYLASSRDGDFGHLDADRPVGNDFLRQLQGPLIRGVAGFVLWHGVINEANLKKEK